MVKSFKNNSMMICEGGSLLDFVSCIYYTSIYFVYSIYTSYVVYIQCDRNSNYVGELSPGKMEKVATPFPFFFAIFLRYFCQI